MIQWHNEHRNLFTHCYYVVRICLAVLTAARRCNHINWIEVMTEVLYQGFSTNERVFSCDLSVKYHIKRTTKQHKLGNKFLVVVSGRAKVVVWANTSSEERRKGTKSSEGKLPVALLVWFSFPTAMNEMQINPSHASGHDGKWMNKFVIKTLLFAPVTDLFSLILPGILATIACCLTDCLRSDTNSQVTLFKHPLHRSRWAK